MLSASVITGTLAVSAECNQVKNYKGHMDDRKQIFKKNQLSPC